MDKLTELFKRHHTKKFKEYGATAKGVDWNDENEMLFRYKKMMDVLNRDFEKPEGIPTVLDVGCGWGGLLAYCLGNRIKVEYTGIDIVESMINYAQKNFDNGEFILGDVFEHNPERKYDYVICNAIMTQKLTASIPEMENFTNRLILKMFELCQYGIAFNLMSTRVNFMVDNLYYRSPVELLNFCFIEVSPRIKLDHGYSSLKRGKGKFYDYTVFIYKD